MRLPLLLERFPALLPTARTLDAHGLQWMIAGSGCLYLHGNERVPEDIDFFLTSAGHHTADRAFGIESFAYQSARETVRNSNPGGDHAMQLTSDLVIRRDGRDYRLEPTELVLSRRTAMVHEGVSIQVAPVEEALLIKVLLGRGEDEGKRDIEDVVAFLKDSPRISLFYINERQEELGLPARFFERAVSAAL